MELSLGACANRCRNRRGRPGRHPLCPSRPRPQGCEKARSNAYQPKPPDFDGHGAAVVPQGLLLLERPSQTLDRAATRAAALARLRRSWHSPAVDATLGAMRQLGYAVKDVDAWVRTYLDTGIGPWWVNYEVQPEEFAYRGAESAARFACAVSWSGPLMLELIQPLDELPSPYRDFLESGREGLQHVAHFPADYEAGEQALLGSGYEKILDGRSGGFRFTYFEPPGVGSETIELGRLSAETREGLDVRQAVCAAWDGNEPLR